MKETVGIIGLGRFGQLLADIFASDFKVVSFDPKGEGKLEDVLKAKTIFICAPIREFEKIITDIAKKVAPDTTIIDTCSVKLYPVAIMEQHLPKTVGIIATHPLFGPDSIENGHTLKVMMHSVRDPQNVYTQWSDFFSHKQISVIEMTPDEHDKLAAWTQGLTHFIGRALQGIHAKSTPIDTAGFAALLKVMEQTCNDTPELFADIQIYNPYTPDAISEFLQISTDIEEKLSQ